MHEKAFEYEIARNRHGVFAVPVSSSYTYTSQAIKAGRVHEPATIEFISNNNKGMDIIHAGTGFGDFLPALSKSCAGTIWTFEPNAENYFCASRTIELNGLNNVELRHHALGSNRSQGFLKVEEDGLALGPRSEMHPGEECTGSCHPCQIVALDEIFPDRHFSIIHLDVEGYEFHVLDGAKDIIARCSPLIILEIDDRAIKYNTYMENIGYKPVNQLIYDAGPMVFVNTVYVASS